MVILETKDIRATYSSHTPFRPILARKKQFNNMNFISHGGRTIITPLHTTYEAIITFLSVKHKLIKYSYTYKGNLHCSP